MTRLPWSAYLALDAVNWSSLKHMDDSAAHYLYHLHNPTPETAAQTIGRYVHAAVLDPDHLAADFVVWNGDRRGSDYKAFAAANADKTILRAADLDDAEGMIEALRARADVRDLLDGAVCEHTVTWTDPETGLACKSRPDLVRLDRRVLADLKTTRSTEIRRFGADIARFMYHGQLAHYAHGIEVALGWVPERVTLIAVESSPPYDVAIFDLEPDTLDAGREKRDNLLARLHEAVKANHWPGRHAEPVKLNSNNLPPWIFGGGLPEFEFTEGETP